MKYDVVVVGSGLSGSVCALKCAQNNLKVLLLEKMNTLGGSSILSTLKMAICNSKIQENCNIQDFPELFLKDIQVLANGMNRQKLTKRVAYDSKYALEFLIENGARFKNEIIHQDGHSVPRTLTPKSGSLSILNPLYDRLLASNNCDILTMNEVVNIKILGDKSVVIIKNLKNNEIYEIEPNLAVVFATGGYSQDKHFISLQNPLTAKIKSKTSIGANANSLKILMRLNAITTLLCQMRYAFDFPIDIIKHSAILSRKNSKRFLNEDSQRQELAFLILTKMNEENAELLPLAIFDTDGINNFYDGHTFDDLLNRRAIRKFNSLDEIAHAYNLNFDGLISSINRYNNDIKNGQDGDYFKNIDDFYIKPIQTAPFYAMEVAPLLNYTQGGVVINEQARVLDLDYKTLANIYAVGEITGGITGESRLISTSSTECAVFALIAANDIIAKFKNI